MADGKVTLPIVGDVDKKYATVGVVAAFGIATVVYIEKRKAKAATASAAATTAMTASTQTDPAGNVGTIDPATGYVYGSPQDEAALQEAQDQGYSDYGGLDSAGGTGDIDPETGYEVGSIADEQALGEVTGATTGSSTVSSTPSSGITTNSQWLTEAESELPGDTATIQTALASVLGGLTVTSAQQQLFMEAVGILGPPPGGYPTPIKTSDTASQPSSGTTTSGSSTPKVTVPQCVGVDFGDAYNSLVSAGLTPGNPAGSINASYTVTGQSIAAGRSVNKGTTVFLSAPAPR